MDCMEGLKQIPDKYIDLAVVDPPYFKGPNKRKYYGHKKSPIGVKRIDYPVIEDWDIPGEEYFKELFRVSKHQIIWGCNYFKYPFGPGRIVWDKCNGKSTFSDAEIAYCSLHNSTKLFRYMWNGMFQGKSIEEGHIALGNKKLNEKRIHPTQKPVNLYRWILRKYAAVGDIILDTHTGSDSCIIAAEEMGYMFIGFEKSKGMYYLAEERRKEYREGGGR